MCIIYVVNSSSFNCHCYKKCANNYLSENKYIIYLKMDKETFQNNVKTVKELVLDEQKIVTYLSLSKDLCIHVNEAKSLLNHTIEDIRETQPKTDLYVCYMISGSLNNNSACTTVCSEKDREALKASLKVIFYEHVYCISRGIQEVDNVALTIINKFEDFSLCTGLIKANSCIKRTDDEIGNLKAARNHNVTNESKPNNVSKKNTTEKSKVMKNGHEAVKKIFEVKSEPVNRSKTPSPKKDTSINGNKNPVKKNGTKSVPKGIAGFFNKANGDSNKIKNTKVKEEKTVDKIETKVAKVIKEKEEPTNIINDIPETPEKVTPIGKSKNKTPSSSLKQIKKTAKVDKKRKRVLHVSDSESETETNDPFADDDNKMAVDQESEDEIPPTPSINTVKITSGIVNPKKRRKIVDKTYTDEDGYILTKKEEVYESCSDHEDTTNVNVKQEKENIQLVTHVKTETPPKGNGKSKKKVSPPQKGKQQTLTNFFKKV